MAGALPLALSKHEELIAVHAAGNRGKDLSPDLEQRQGEGSLRLRRQQGLSLPRHELAPRSQGDTLTSEMQDTSSVALDRYHQLLRAQAPHQRLSQAVALSKMTRELAEAGIQQRFPTASPAEIRIRLAVRLYGADVARRLFGDVPPNAR
jgi:hypothetical protein